MLVCHMTCYMKRNTGAAAKRITYFYIQLNLKLGRKLGERSNFNELRNSNHSMIQIKER